MTGAGVRLITGVVSLSYPLGYQKLSHYFYLTAIRNLVDMAGYLPFFATLRVTTQEAEAFGAFNLVPTMEHGPDSLQVFAPFDKEESNHDKGVVEPFFTIDFLTVKPGRAAS